MSRKRGAAVVTFLVAVLVVSVNVLPSAAQEPPPPPISPEFLSDRAVFTDAVHRKFRIRLDKRSTQIVRVNDPSTTVVARFTVQPGAQFPWHSHAGPVVVNVVEGELVYVDAMTCTKRSYPAGKAFVDPGQGHVHSAFNPTDEETVFVATFYDAPPEGSLLIPAEAPEDCL